MSTIFPAIMAVIAALGVGLAIGNKLANKTASEILGLRREIETLNTSTAMEITRLRDHVLALNTEIKELNHQITSLQIDVKVLQSLNERLTRAAHSNEGKDHA